MPGMDFPYGETVTVIRTTRSARYGDTTDGTSFTLSGCGFAPRGSSELEEQRVTVITGYTMYAPADADIRPTDVVVRESGTRWQVKGEPGYWVSPFTGWAAGIEVALERVTG